MRWTNGCKNSLQDFRHTHHNTGKMSLLPCFGRSAFFSLSRLFLVWYASDRKGMSMELRDRYRGSLLGLAIGDALGTTLEFSQPGSFVPLEEMVGAGPFALSPGEWTDD